MNTHVKLELAKLLKEKGFNEPCQFLRVAGNYRINFEKEGELFNNGMPSTQKPIDWFLAPTIAEVIMWLYEKNGIWIWAIPLYNLTSFQAAVENKNTMKFIEGFNTPTEAYEAAIQYALTKII